MRIKSVSGKIDLVCEDVAGEIHTFTYTFEVEPVYNSIGVYNLAEGLAYVLVHIDPESRIRGPTSVGEYSPQVIESLPALEVEAVEPNQMLPPPLSAPSP